MQKLDKDAFDGDNGMSMKNSEGNESDTFWKFQLKRLSEKVEELVNQSNALEQRIYGMPTYSDLEKKLDKYTFDAYTKNQQISPMKPVEVPAAFRGEVNTDHLER